MVAAGAVGAGGAGARGAVAGTVRRDVVAGCNAVFAREALVWCGRVVMGARKAARAEERRWHRHQRPGRTFWHRAFIHEGGLFSREAVNSSVRKDDRLLILDELQRLEVALFEIGKLRRQRGDAVLVAPAVVVADLPSHFGGAARLVRWGPVARDFLEHLRSRVAVLRKLCLGVVAGFGTVRAGRRSSREAASVRDRGAAWGSPRVVLVLQQNEPDQCGA